MSDVEVRRDILKRLCTRNGDTIPFLVGCVDELTWMELADDDFYSSLLVKISEMLP